MKLQLINAPLVELYKGISRSGVYPPLNLISLATYIFDNIAEVEVEILDGDILSLSEILGKLDADFVGISPKILTYENSLIIAEEAKKLGSTVIFGGPHASALYKEILRNRPFVDYVILGDGEDALSNILKQKPIEHQNNIAYRKDSDIIKNDVTNLNLNTLPIQDNSQIDLAPYFSNLTNRFKGHPLSKGISVYSQKGCVWQTEHGGCIFCRRFDSSLRFKSPEVFWGEIRSLIKKHNADFIWNVSDTITGSKNWLKEIVLKKPNKLEAKFLVYGRSDEIDREVADYLSAINSYEVLLGVESGNDEILRRSNKGFTRNDSINAIKLLTERDIYSYPSFVLGLPGESKSSALETFDFATEILSIGKVYQLACSTLIPLPDSIAFYKMMRVDSLRKKYQFKDNINVEELRKDWVQHFCEVDYEFLEEMLDNILKQVEIASSFGLTNKVCA